MLAVQVSYMPCKPSRHRGISSRASTIKPPALDQWCPVRDGTGPVGVALVGGEQEAGARSQDAGQLGEHGDPVGREEHRVRAHGPFGAVEGTPVAVKSPTENLARPCRT